jgi:hypothetical protein
MGNRIKTLTWTWPLILIDWVPEILASFDSMIEPTWVGLKREMTFFAKNQSFADRTFAQLRTLLTETALVEEKEKHIIPTVGPNCRVIKMHLINLFEENSRPWSSLFRLLSERKLQLHFDQIKTSPPNIWPEISNYRVFKQWTEFFQFIGFGFLTSPGVFAPESALSESMYKNPRFIETCLRAAGDPRHLTGRLSLHTEADFMAWTKGEDRLPISESPDLIPRIPYDLIMETYETSKNERGAWSRALERAETEWRSSIRKELSNWALANLEELVISCKHFIDHFLFGRPCYTNDYIDVEIINRTKKTWNLVKNFKMSDGIWKILPNYYRDITRLYWGVSHYRNSLKRPVFTTSMFTESIFNLKDLNSIRKIPIRCHRSRRTLCSILSTLLMIYKVLSRLNPNFTGPQYEMETKRIHSENMDYLPADTLQIKELLNDVENLIELYPEEKKYLLNQSKVDIRSGYPENPILQMCFWVHRYNEFLENPHMKTINIIREKLKKLEERLIGEMRYFGKALDRWNIACENLKKKAFSMRSTQK